MKLWFGLLVALVLTSCEGSTIWVKTAEESALSFKEQQIDPWVERLQERAHHSDASILSTAINSSGEPNQSQNYLLTGPTWKGITLAQGAHLVYRDRTATGESALYYVSNEGKSITTDLLRELGKDNWFLLEHMSNRNSRGDSWEYLSFWRDQLSFLPQQYFVTACALVQEEKATGLTTLEIGTRCAQMRQTAVDQGFDVSLVPFPDGWQFPETGSPLTQVPFDQNSLKPFSSNGKCKAPSNFLCVDQHSLERNDSTLTLRLLVGQGDVFPVVLHPERVLEVSQSIVQGSLPLLMQPVVIQGSIEGIQLYSLSSSSEPFSVRSELHFLQGKQYVIFEGSLTGGDSRIFHQVPILSQMIQRIETKIVE